MRQPTIALRSMAGAGLALGLLSSCVTVFEPDRQARAPVLDGFGQASMTISTRVPEAQRWFSQGLLQTYAFNHKEAVRDFKAALAQDPACAMCAWGVAHALGPNINAIERDDLAEARRYLGHARRHLAGATPRERGLIEALEARYAQPSAAADAKAARDEAPALAAVCSSGGSGRRADPLDVAYALRLRALVETYPDDPDLTTLHAEAVMIATRVDWWDRTSGIPAGEIGAVTRQLEQGLVRWPDHTGLNHFLVHAVDASPAPGRATRAADRLGLLAPQAPHLLHMPAHIYVRTGRYADAVAVNQSALAAELRQSAAFTAQGFEPSANWDGHNLHFLWFAALMQGQGDLALAQATRLAERAAKGKSIHAEFMRALPLLTLVRLERWGAVLAQPLPTGDNGIAAPIAGYARGVALARTGEAAQARASALALRASIDAPMLAGKTVMGDDPARTVLEILAAQLQAEIASADVGADGVTAQVALDRAISLEAALEANEPPLLGAGSRLALGQMMLHRQRWADAETAFRGELDKEPGSGWALRGLQRALAGQGKADEAARVLRDLERAWPGADAPLRAPAAL